MLFKIQKYIIKNSLYICLILLSFYYFIFLGEQGYFYTNDSLGYLSISFGRFPVYPLLFHLFKTLFGSEKYQLYVTYFQGLLAVFSVISLLIYLCRRFNLVKWETFLVYFALILPYGIDTLWDTPRYVYTHSISTEGITYSLYYLFILCLFYFLLDRKSTGLWGVLILTPLMCCTRTQLMICYPVILFSIIYIYWKNISRVIISLLLMFFSVLSITVINNGYHWYFQGDFEPSSVNEFTLFANLIFVSDVEDVSLMPDEITKSLYQDIFDQSYSLKYNYDFASDGFIGLADKLIDSHDKIKYDILHPVMQNYADSLYLSSDWKEDLAIRDILRSMSTPLRNDNFLKWLHTCLVLIPESLMLSFNPITPPQVLKLLYAYSMLITITITVYIIIRLIKYKTLTPPLLALSAVFILLITNAAGLSFSIYGLSRYTNYNLGLIYVMIYLCLRRDHREYQSFFK